MRGLQSESFGFQQFQVRMSPGQYMFWIPNLQMDTRPVFLPSTHPIPAHHSARLVCLVFRSPTEEHGLQRPIIVEFRVAHAFMPKINYIEALHLRNVHHPANTITWQVE